MKKTFASRSMKLLGLAAKVGREELSQALKETVSGALSRGLDEIASDRLKSRVEQARLIADNLSQLKGAAMKAGQLLSLDAGDYLPPEAIEVLSKLQSSAEPMDFAVIQKVLESDLGARKLAQFEKFETRPAAAASIGQVHRARLNGRDVAVKVQYPGVADSIDSDLKLLRTFAQGFIALSGKNVDLKELFEELAVVLKKEADYALEFRNLAEYRQLLNDHPDFFAPEPIESHSTKRVLTMTWLEGMPFNEWIKTNPSVAERERIGRLMLDLYCMEFYDWGLVQTDPNYGNFFIDPATPGKPTRVGLLDFGATLRYDGKFREDYKRLLRSLNTLDRSLIADTFEKEGLLDPRESNEAKSLFVDLMMLAVEPFQASLQPFHFKDADYARRSREAGTRMVKNLRYSPPPRKIIFLHRKLGGVFTLLKKLDVELDISPYWERMVGSALGSTTRTGAP